MGIIEDILKWPAIIQSILGSIIFATFLWGIKKAYIFFSNSIKEARVSREYDELTKYYIYEYYINTRGLFYFSQGYLLVIFKTLYGILTMITISVFWILSSRIIEPNIYIDIFFGGLIILKVFDLQEWYKPKLSKGKIENYDEEIVVKVRKNLLDERGRNQEINKDINDKTSSITDLEEKVSKLKNELTGE